MKTYYNSPLGLIEIIASEDAIISVGFVDEENPETTKSQILDECSKELDEYFFDTRKSFTVSLDPQGTQFQKQVWNELVHIPFGTTLTYLDVARSMNNEKAVRAVGAANGANPIAIIIPCHRVIGADGSLTGYAGGMEKKEWLLRHEGYQPLKEQMKMFA